jgi:hypothetical protein
MDVTNQDWLCPWCGEVASDPANAPGICESRNCTCGAMGIGAPPWDTDEIIDDAIAIFGIAEGFLTSFDADRVAGLQRVGVEVVEGQSVPADGSNRFELRVLWFRRREMNGPADR